jgi:hypothetical protein
MESARVKSAPAFPDRERATPKPRDVRIAKPFGYSYQIAFGESWKRYFRWFSTRTRRDQALANHNRKYVNSIHSDWITCADVCER